MNNMNMLYPLIMESFGGKRDGNEDAFLELGEVEVYDNNLKSIITIKTEDFIKVVNDAMYKISSEYKFFYTYLKYSKVFYIPTYPSRMGINTMAVDEKKNLWMNVHFIYNQCKMDKDRVFGILFHELMHNFLKHQARENALYPAEYRTKQHHMKSNICQDFEVNASMVEDGVVDKSFWDRMGGLYNPSYTGMRWEDILKKHGDKEYEDWLKRSGMRLDDKTKKALEAIEKALGVLGDDYATDAEKERAGETLKSAMDELYGHSDRKIVDKADLKGIRRELDKLADSRLGEINDLASSIQNVSDDLITHPQKMDEHDISVTVGDIQKLRKDMRKSAEEIGETFRKNEEDVKNDVDKAMKSLIVALNTLHEGGVDIKEERKIIRRAKDDLEGIILNSIEKRRREEKRKMKVDELHEKKKMEKIKKEREIKKAEDKMSKAEEMKEKLKKKNPLKKFVDTFKNLRELESIGRISNRTGKTLDKVIEVLDTLSNKTISDVIESDIKSIRTMLSEPKVCFSIDLIKLTKDKLLKMTEGEINKFLDDVFNDIDKFFGVVLDEDEPTSVKFGAMSLAVEGLRKLGKKLKVQKKIKPSAEWKEAYKSERARLIRIYKTEGKGALAAELKKMGM